MHLNDFSQFPETLTIPLSLKNKLHRSTLASRLSKLNVVLVNRHKLFKNILRVSFKMWKLLVLLSFCGLAVGKHVIPLGNLNNASKSGKSITTFSTLDLRKNLSRIF